MKEYLNAIESRLFDDQKDMLQRIYAPTVVAVPLADSRRSVCVLPDGCPTGLSYLILQCATDGDSEGFCIRSLEKR